MLWANVLILCIMIVLTLVLLISAEKYTKSIGERLDPEIPRFSAEARWDPYPQEQVSVENQFDCNVETLRTCRLDDPTTLAGCRELAVRCHHFDREVQYYAHGVRRTVPSNTSANEGYALAITSLADACNPYHGDLTLVAKNAESTEYMLICYCKQPGYIGNDDLLGPCTSVFICGGKIDSVNKPLSDINCVCGKSETNARYEDDGLPVCKPLLVHEANRLTDDWSKLVNWGKNASRLIDRNAYNATVRDNVASSVLLDPCRVYLDEPSEPVLGGRYVRESHTCAFTDYGIPVRVGTLDSVDAAAAAASPDDKEKSHSKQLLPVQPVDGAVSSRKHTSVRLIDRVGGKRMRMNVRTRTKRYADGQRDVFVNLPENLGLGNHAQFSLTTRDQMVGGRCEGEWPSYQCKMTEYFANKTFGVPRPGYRGAPGSFLWSWQDWEAAEKAVSEGIVVRKEGVAIDNDKFYARDNWLAYGVQYCSADEPTERCRNGMLSFMDQSDYQRHKNVLT